MCIIGTQHQCNGIETDLVVHIYPEDCPWCEISNADPVIISRAMAMLIISTYQRVQCGCGWKALKEEADGGWRTPENQSDDEDNPDTDSLLNQEFSTEHEGAFWPIFVR